MIMFIFNWTGPQFLTFYGIAFVMALIWSIARRKNILKSLNPPSDSPPRLTDPIEIAYLAGGASRCAEVALVNLIEQGSLKWQKGGLLAQGELTIEGPLPADCHWFERGIYSAISTSKNKKCPLKDLSETLKKLSPPLEGRLAKLGLKPTSSEISSQGTKAVYPLLFLFYMGVFKALVGLVREKPIGFLLIFLFVTLITLFLVKATVAKLTPAGQKLLDQMRGGRGTTPEPGLASVALFGIAGATAYADMPQIDPSMLKELQTTFTTSSGSDGCSSGCGGGCGGCGGCG